MNCFITKLPTKNKWKNKPIHPLALEKAKLMMQMSDSKKVTMRNCLISLQRQFQQILMTEKEVSNEKYAELLKKFLGGDE